MGVLLAYDITPLTTGTSERQERTAFSLVREQQTIATEHGVNLKTDDQLAGAMDRRDVVKGLKKETHMRKD